MRIPMQGCTVHALCTCKQPTPLYEVTFIGQAYREYGWLNRIATCRLYARGINR